MISNHESTTFLRGGQDSNPRVDTKTRLSVWANHYWEEDNEFISRWEEDGMFISYFKEENAFVSVWEDDGEFYVNLNKFDQSFANALIPELVRMFEDSGFVLAVQGFELNEGRIVNYCIFS